MGTPCDRFPTACAGLGKGQGVRAAPALAHPSSLLWHLRTAHGHPLSELLCCVVVTGRGPGGDSEPPRPLHRPPAAPVSSPPALGSLGCPKASAPGEGGTRWWAASSELGTLLWLQPRPQRGTRDGWGRFASKTSRCGSFRWQCWGAEGINPGTAASVGLQAAAPGAGDTGLTR